ncbi:TAXI family TRAP transporter solute-binding subunit [Pseudoroseicyclus sp. CXY001]|uniref:TAXI family TRAP transporter solute-binding subunit n=1 Tax=Pseudoroseicyclus sp. CXY001 TaxID=3242492 RepID=UPI003570F436
MTTTRFIRHLAGLAALAGVAAPALAQDVDIGTMGQGTLSYSTGSAVAQVLQAEGGFNARVQPNSGETTIMPLVNTGELDLGIASVGEVANAIEGTGVFEGRAQGDMLALAALFPLKVAIFARADSGIETMQDLAGHSLTTDFSAMGVINDILIASLANAGLTLDDIDPVAVPNVVRGADDFIAGRADAFFFGIGSAKVLEADASVGGVTMLPLDDSEEAVARMQEVFPEGYLSEQVVLPNTPGFDAPMMVMTYDNILLVNSAVPDEVVAEMARVLAENKEALVANFPPFGGLVVEDLYKDLPIPYHPGAIAFYEEAGL